MRVVKVLPVPDAEELYQAGGEKRLKYFEASLVARRRISAEAFRIRAFLDEVFKVNSDALVIITGDLNFPLRTSKCKI